MNDPQRSSYDRQHENHFPSPVEHSHWTRRDDLGVFLSLKRANSDCRKESKICCSHVVDMEPLKFRIDQLQILVQFLLPDEAVKWSSMELKRALFSSNGVSWHHRWSCRRSDAAEFTCSQRWIDVSRLSAYCLSA